MKKNKKRAIKRPQGAAILMTLISKLKLACALEEWSRLPMWDNTKT